MASDFGRINQCDYVFVVTDGTRMLAVDTDGEDVPNYKSYLTPKNAGYVEDRLRKLSVLELQFEIPEPKVIDKKDQLSASLLLLDEKYVQGLTRVEKDMKAILMTYLYTLLTSTNKEEVRYWYSEVFPGTFNNAKVKKMRTSTMVQKMFDELKEGWEDRHIRLGDEIIKSHDIFADSWKALKKKQKEVVKNK